MLYLDKTFQKEWEGKSPFEEVEKLDGQIFRNVKNRKTLQFTLNNKRYFLKLHHGVGWKEIFKNLVIFKKPITSAKNEYDAINKLHSLNVDTMTVCAFGIRGMNPANYDSFIITETLENTTSLEDLGKEWIKTPPSSAFKHALIKKVAQVSRTLHTNGINHRDYYICHFLIDNQTINTVNPKLYLIDLHRTQIRPETPYRWKVKDAAGIWFSSMNLNLSKIDRLRFIRYYSAKKLKDEFKHNLKFWEDVNNTALKLYAKEFRK